MRYVEYNRRSQDPERWVAAFAGALVAHLLLVIGMPWVWPTGPATNLAPEHRFDAMELIAVTDPNDEESEEPPVVPQMVSLPPPEREERPDEARFADQFDRTTEEEMVNRSDVTGPEADGRPEQRVGAAVAPGPRIPQERSAVPMAPPPSPEPRPTREASAGPATAPEGNQPGPEQVAETNEQGSDLPASEGDPGGLPVQPFDLGMLRPTAGNAGAAIAAGARRSDHLDLPEGERTALNSTRSLYWSFFNRLHQRVEREWDPNAAFAIHDPSFALYGQTDRYTILRVTLQADGALRHAFVERSSGLDFYDDEAIRAFRAAAPFGSVPEGLKDERGLATFDFGFYFTFRTRNAFVRRVEGY